MKRIITSYRDFQNQIFESDNSQELKELNKILRVLQKQGVAHIEDNYWRFELDQINPFEVAIELGMKEDDVVYLINKYMLSSREKEEREGAMFPEYDSRYTSSTEPDNFGYSSLTRLRGEEDTSYRSTYSDSLDKDWFN